MADEPVKVNLGSGSKPLAGYVNLDGRWGHQLFPLCGYYALENGSSWEMPEGGVDEVRASHVLEHFPYGQLAAVVTDWVAHLKPGGVLKLAVPDFKKLSRAYLEQGMNVQGYVCGGQGDERDYHKAILDEALLREVMAQAGLTNIASWVSEIDDCAALDISLNLLGTKSAPPSGRQLTNIAAVMSVPRLTFTENVACIYRTITRLGIECHAGTGVFWHHALTRQIEDRLAAGADYILAVDYDSWFLPEHVGGLVSLMAATSEADAICAVQCRREDSLPIMGIHDDAGQPMRSLPRAMFAEPLTRIHIAHFGLTLFRAACFARLAKPWFRDRPDPEGSWRDGRRDADVAFWDNFEAAGCRVFMANELSIGHLQQICTFPGRAEDNWRPVHVYLKDLNAGRVPAHCTGARSP